MNSKKPSIKKIIKLVISIAFCISFLLLNPSITNAASGGRIGGGQFRSPSIPRARNYGGYGGSYGGYGTNRYRGGGIGFPFLIPFFGFGGGGLFGLLVIIAISGFFANVFRGLSNTNTYSESKKSITDQGTNQNVKLIQLQMGLLASAKEIQSDLRELAKNSDTITIKGLQSILLESTLALLRQPEFWVYSNIESGEVPFNTAEETFNRLSINERGKLNAELTSNFSGKKIEPSNKLNTVGNASEISEFIAVTIIVATSSNINFTNSFNSEQLKENLKKLGSIPSKDLIALEIIWQPDGEGEVLTTEELITFYPNLKFL